MQGTCQCWGTCCNRVQFKYSLNVRFLPVGQSHSSVCKHRCVIYTKYSQHAPPFQRVAIRVTRSNTYANFIQPTWTECAQMKQQRVRSHASTTEISNRERYEKITCAPRTIPTATYTLRTPAHSSIGHTPSTR